MKKYMVALTLLVHSVYGASTNQTLDSTTPTTRIAFKVETFAPSKAPTTYMFYGTAIINDGTGDITHAERLLAKFLLAKFPNGVILSSALCHVYNEGTFKESIKLDVSGATIKDEEQPHFAIAYHACNVGNELTHQPMGPHSGPTTKIPTIAFSELSSQDVPEALPEASTLLFLPLGLKAGLGYMSPPEPIDHTVTKSDIFSTLHEKYQKLVYGEHGFENTLLILGYYSKGVFPRMAWIDPSILKAFMESPLCAGKRIIVFAKGDPSDNMNYIVGELRKELGDDKVVTTGEFIPDHQWHILQQLADVTIPTGDSSYSDSLYYRSLPIWNCHKATEARLLMQAAFLADRDGDMSNEYRGMKFNSIKEFYEREPMPEGMETSSNRVVQYLQKLIFLKERRDKQSLIDFMRTIDQSFMKEWETFCKYMEGRYTFTPEKMAAIIDVGTKMVLGQHPDLKPYEGVLNKRTIALLERVQQARVSPEATPLLIPSSLP